ncbi:sulfatase [Flavobacterium sp. NG2]|uniref:sulfatase n=1 Tax=Flavobacterium sp. NG2 TaxID=3097547 RepID=UPI002A83E45E|nr:sulfatase [Flavobacterium sp. NG2]WPR71959.1 sulfatase [Flavobacterium sp. NG2]
MKNIFKIVGIVCCALLVTTKIEAQKKPNILFILVDDFGYHDISSNGSKIYQTPNMDALAKTSVSFENGYCSYPRCVPSRYALMTGTYPVNEDHGDLSKLNPEQNFIKTFKSNGYSSFFVGKWHLGSDGSSPVGIGYDQSFAAGDAGATDQQFYPFNTKRVAGAKGEKAPIEDVEKFAKEGDYLSDVLTKRTIAYIKESKKDKPFLGVLAFYAVHTPIEAKKEDEARNQKEINAFDFGSTPEYVKEGHAETKMRQDNAKYAGMVENVDENVGKLIKALKDQGLYDNTIIVLTSDHGGLSTRGGKREVATTNFPLRAGKGWLYEGGLRVPLMVHVPNTKPFVDKESIVLGMDIFPTLTDLALNKEISGIDGKSFKNIITKKENWNDRVVYWNSYKARPTQTGDDKTSAVRKGEYKLLEFVESGKIELYNIKKDSGEQHDLAATMPEKKAELLALLTKWKKDYQIKMKANHKSGGENISPKKEAEMEAKKEAKRAERKAAKKQE